MCCLTHCYLTMFELYSEIRVSPVFCLSNELENTNVDHDVMVDELVLHHINLYYVHV